VAFHWVAEVAYSVAPTLLGAFGLPYLPACGVMRESPVYPFVTGLWPPSAKRSSVDEPEHISTFNHDSTILILLIAITHISRCISGKSMQI